MTEDLLIFQSADNGDIDIVDQSVQYELLTQRGVKFANDLGFTLEEISAILKNVIKLVLQSAKKPDDDAIDTLLQAIILMFPKKIDSEGKRNELTGFLKVVIPSVYKLTYENNVETTSKAFEVIKLVVKESMDK